MLSLAIRRYMAHGNNTISRSAETMGEWLSDPMQAPAKMCDIFLIGRIERLESNPWVLTMIVRLRDDHILDCAAYL